MSRRARALPSRSYPWSDLDPERRNSLLLLGGIALIILFAIVLISYGYYTERVAPANDTVITIGNREFDYGYLERRTKAEIARGRVAVASLSEDFSQVVTLIEREELMRQSAAATGITVSDAEIEERYHVRLGVPSGASREQLASQLRLELVRLGLPLAEFRETVAAEVLERKLLDNFEVAVPTEAEHVEARLILVPTQAAAIQVRDRLNNGESFGLVAASASIHASRNTAGELSWVPTQSLVKEVGEVAASLDIGGRSDIIEARSGFYFIEITGRENRAVTADGREDIGQQRLEELMAETRERLGTELTITAEQLQKLFLSLSADVG